MVKAFLDNLANIGLLSNVDIGFGGDLTVKLYDVVYVAFFVIALVNVWFALKFLFKKVL